MRSWSPWSSGRGSAACSLRRGPIRWWATSPARSASPAAEENTGRPLRETWEEIGIPPEEIRVLAPLDLMQDISDRVVYPFLAEISAAGAARLKASAAEVKNVFFVPVDYLLNYKEEVYRYVVSAKVDDDFPYERIGFPKTYPWRKGYMNVPIYEYQGHFIWGMTGRMVRWLLQQLRQMEQQEGKA